MIVDADLSAIEWRVCAELTQDPVMIEEIQGGRDQHAYTCTELMELPLTKENRTNAKIFNFRAIYADASSAAYAYYMDPKMPNFSQRKWDKVIEGFFTHYAGMVRAHAEWVKQVRATGQFRGPTGRVWTFEKEKRGGALDYSVAKIYNYPVQGTAGDLIKLAMIKIRKEIRARNLATLMVNTVHDSLIFDAPEEEVMTLAEICQNTFRNLPNSVEEFFGWKMVVPIAGEVESGPSWGETKLIEVTK